MKKILSNKIIIFIVIIVLIAGITTIFVLMNNKDHLSRLNDNTSTTTTSYKTTTELETTTIKEENTSIVSSKTNITIEKSSTKKKVISESSTKKTTKQSSTTEKKIEQTECLTELEKDVPLYYDLGCGMRAEDASLELASHWDTKGIGMILSPNLVKEMDACDEIISAGCHDVILADYITIKGTNNKYLRGYAIRFKITEYDTKKLLAEGYIKSDNTL